MVFACLLSNEAIFIFVGERILCRNTRKCLPAVNRCVSMWCSGGTPAVNVLENVPTLLTWKLLRKKQNWKKIGWNEGENKISRHKLLTLSLNVSTNHHLIYSFSGITCQSVETKWSSFSSYVFGCCFFFFSLYCVLFSHRFFLIIISTVRSYVCNIYLHVWL